MALVLVTGATGRHGGTGAVVAWRLREEGHTVRVLVRRHDERSAALEAEGYDVRVGDLRDRLSLLDAMTGVTMATFCYPVDAGIIEAATSFASALRQAAPKARVVVMSMLAAHEASPSHLGRAQWLAEEALLWSGLSVRILRIAALFYENVTLLHGQSIRDRGVIRNCFGAAKTPWIAGVDAAELMVSALLHPERFGDDPISYPSGAVSHSHDEIAALLSHTLGRDVRFENVSRETWRDELVTQARGGSVAINEDMAAHISTLASAMAARGATRSIDAPALAWQLGRAPVPFEVFARDRASELNAASR